LGTARLTEEMHTYNHTLTWLSSKFGSELAVQKSCGASAGIASILYVCMRRHHIPQTHLHNVQHIHVIVLPALVFLSRMTHSPWHPLHEQEDVTCSVGNIYQCFAGHLHCSVCVDEVKLRSPYALCPMCGLHQIGEIRCISLEKHRDRKIEQVRAKAAAALVSRNDVNHVNSLVFARRDTAAFLSTERSASLQNAQPMRTAKIYFCGRPGTRLRRGHLRLLITRQIHRIHGARLVCRPLQLA